MHNLTRLPAQHQPFTIEAVLFDLDGTLLDNSMDTFLPHYFQQLAARMAHLLPPEQFVSCLLQASQAMMANDGRATNEEVFARDFYPRLGRSRQEVEPIFEDFYARDFPQLARYTRRKPEARQVVQMAFDLGCTVVIATNPLFPATAIEQRLAWAGVDGFPYSLVTTYENSRACKLSLLYYEHILEAIGCPARACLMVGDEAVDMAAAQLGCSTFFVAGSTELEPRLPQPTRQGSLQDLLVWLESWQPADGGQCA